MKISVIVPAYNAEAYIGRCLDSLLRQDCVTGSGEIIVVNDGSTDATGHILETYRERHPDTIRVITQTNQGVSAARNAGLNAAQGGVILFCDSDDYIIPDGLDYVVSNFLDDDVDLLTFWSITLDEIALRTFTEPDTVSGEVIYEGTTLDWMQNESPCFVWNHLYRRTAIKGIAFRPLTIGEDSLFNMEVYSRNLQLRRTNANIYRYTVSPNQLTRKRDTATMRQAVRGFQALFERAMELHREQQGQTTDCFRRVIASNFRSYMSRVLCAGYTASEARQLLGQLRRQGITPVMPLGRLQKALNFIAMHPWLYPIVSRCYTRLFIPYILPKLSRN